MSTHSAASTADVPTAFREFDPPANTEILALRDRLAVISRLAQAIIMLTDEPQVAAVAGQIDALAGAE